MSLFVKISNIFYQKRQLIKDYFFNSLSDLNVKIYLAILLALNVVIWVISIIINSSIDDKQIALHYNVDFGIDYYGDITKIYIIPLLGLIIILINFILYSSVSYSKDRKFISHFLFSTAIAVNIILLTGITLVYLINFR